MVVQRSEVVPFPRFVKTFWLFLFFTLLGLVRTSQTVAWHGVFFSPFFLPPLLSCVVALMPLWLGDWELSITRWRTGSLLKKVHVGQKEMAGVWQAG